MGNALGSRVDQKVLEGQEKKGEGEVHTVTGCTRFTDLYNENAKYFYPLKLQQPSPSPYGSRRRSLSSGGVAVAVVRRAASECMHCKADILFLKHESNILGHSSNPVCGFSMMQQVRLCAVWPMGNWLGSSTYRVG